MHRFSEELCAKISSDILAWKDQHMGNYFSYKAQGTKGRTRRVCGISLK